MQKSLVIEGWRDEGRLEANRETLLSQLQEKFGALPDDLVQRIQALTDQERLRASLRQIVHIERPDELRL